MTVEDFRKLDEPKREDFKDKTWAAISFARQWTLNRGDIDADVAGNFDKHYSEGERETITALIQIMDFANRFNNTWFKPLDRQKMFGISQ